MGQSKEINVTPLGIASCIHNCIKQQGKAGRCLDVYVYADLKSMEKMWVGIICDWTLRFATQFTISVYLELFSVLLSQSTQIWCGWGCAAWDSKPLPILRVNLAEKVTNF